MSHPVRCSWPLIKSVDGTVLWWCVNDAEPGEKYCTGHLATAGIRSVEPVVKADDGEAGA